MRNRSLTNAIAGVMLACHGTMLLANPTGPAVVSGSGKFEATGKGLTVTTTPGAIINWQSFSIQRDEATHFVQQNGASAVLNRVTGSTPSSILGQLSSNGRVFLINPNGVVVGNGATIDVAGFVVSSLHLSDADFRAGRFKFGEQPTGGSVINNGVIRTPSGGAVYLVAPRVENRGLIVSPQGEIILAAGQSVELVNAGSPDLRVELKAPDNQAINLGQLLAGGGSVGMYGALIQHGGVASASSVERTADGRIVFKGTRDVTLGAGSSLEVNGRNGGRVLVQAQGGTLVSEARIEAKGSQGKGGEVQLLGQRVGLTGAAGIDASGSSGGGSVLVGGDYQGKNPLAQNAARSFVGAGVQLRADATDAGDGGKVIVWSDEATRTAGTISARGGERSGNGGLIEVSSHGYLDFTASINTIAPNGDAGLLLLDPSNVTISTGADSGGLGTGPNFQNGTGASVLNVTTLLNALATSDVLVSTSPGSGGAGNITVQNAVTYAGVVDRKLTLQADNTITVTQAISASATAGRLSVDLQADRDNSGAGDVLINNAITTRGGSFSASGVNITRGGSGAVDTTGTAGRNGGDITLTAATAGTVNFGGGLTSTGGAALAAGAGMNAGAVNVSGRTITLTTVTARGSNAAGANLQGGNGGEVNVTKTGTAAAITLNNNIDTRGGNSVGTGNGGSGGAVTINGGTGTVTVANNRSINTTGGTGQDGGAVSITAAGAVTFNPGSSITTSGGTASTVGVAPGAGLGRNAGTVGVTGADVTVVAITARGSNAAAASNKAGGTGGTVSLNATDATPLITLGGNVAANGGNGNGTGVGGVGAAVTVADPAVLNANVAVTTSGGTGSTVGAAGLIQLQSVDSSAGARRNLTLTAGNPGTAAIATGNLGATTPLGTVQVRGATVTTGSISTPGLPDANGAAVTINADTGALTTGAIITSGQTGAGVGRNGGNTTLTGRTVNLNGTVTSSGSNAVAGIGGNAGVVAVTSNAAVSPLTTLGGNVSARGGNGVGANGGNGANVTFAGSVRLAANATIHSLGGTGVATGTGGNVTFSGAATTINSDATARTLTIDAGAGAVSLQAAAGVTTALASLSASGNTVSARAVTTSGSQTLTGIMGVTLNGTLQSTGTAGADTISVNGPVTLAGATTVQTAGGAGDGIAFSSTVNGARAFSADAGNNGTLAFGGSVGQVTALTSFSARAGGVTLPAVRAGTIFAQSTTGDITLNGVQTATAAGHSIVLASAANWINNAGGAPMNPGAGRFLVYSQNPTLNSFGSFVSPGNAFGRTYAANPPGSPSIASLSGSRMVYSITPTLAVTADDKSKVYGNGDPALTFTTSGLVVGDTTASALTGALARTPGENVGGHAINQGTVAATNLGYAISYNAGTLIVTPRPISLQAADQSRAYGDIDPTTGGYSIMSGTLAFTDSVANVDVSSPATLTSPVGSYALSPTAANFAVGNAGNYAITFADGTLLVTQRPITVQASDRNRFYGNPNPLTGTFTLTAGSLVGTDAIASLNLTSPATTASNVGSYALTPTAANFSSGSASNYVITLADGTLFVVPRSITVVADDRTKVYGSTDPAFTYVATGLVGADVLSGALTRNPGETVLVGPYAITQGTLTSANNPNYNIAFTNGQLVITPKPISVTADNQSKIYGSPDPVLTYVATGLVGSDTLSGALTRAAGGSVVGSPYAITQGSVTNANNPNYSIAFANGQLTIAPKPITVAANNQTKTYGAPDPGLTYVATGLVGSDTLSGSLSRTPGESVLGAPYAINHGSVTDANNPNYSIAYTPGALTVIPAPLLIQANNAARPPGQPNPAFTASATGFRFGEGFGDLGGVLIFSTLATPMSPAGLYPITPAGVTSTNYAITFLDGSLVVTVTPTSDIAPESALYVAVDRSGSGPEGLEPAQIAEQGRLDCLAIERGDASRQVLYRCR